MYLKSRKIAFLGLLTAIGVILVILGSVVEVSTLCFVTLASFLVGAAIRETGVVMGAGSYVATVILSFFLSPNKIYCLTYSAFSIYIIGIEAMIHVLAKKNSSPKKFKCTLLIIKYIIFNVIYLPILFLLPSLIYSGKFTTAIYVLAILGGQVIFYLFDRVYFMCMDYYQRDLRKRMRL